ncbi:putative quinol monooxygenase [Streptomyces bohaiensis]|uniref:Antibiotic biosynthesis monooxygenase n=1 Tax=Streptomyces bohaiensis TaxID=1431344 RepID=A0ABX1C579_9ACTN|nr:antibiotic biosynthesis monooxygenase [Streptomyces bohaiensis]NJQ14371.1 antibiotic biosynthesis monooxygenase [Streptomyces bohaiensis]
MSMGFGLYVRFTLRDEGAAAGFDALVAATAPKIASEEPGTLTYVVHTVEGEPLVRVFYELYADRAAFASHEEQPHVKHFLAQREQYLRDVQVTFLDATAGKLVRV